MDVVPFALVLALLAFSACAPQVSDGSDAQLAPDLTFYPRFFFAPNGSFDAAIVVDENAPELDRASARMIAEDLAALDPAALDAIRTYPAYSDILTRNSILIGSCSQVPQNRFVNIYVDCLSMRDDQAIVRVTPKADAWILEVVGKTPEDTRRAVEALVGRDPRIVGQDVEVRFTPQGTSIGEPT